MISVIIPTARDDYPIIGMPDVFVLEPTFKSLEKQKFRDFEVIVVDALYPDKKEWIDSRKWSFPVKYVPPHPNHSFWVNRGLWGVAGMLNSAILHAEGDLIVRMDDCSEALDDEYLSKFWDLYLSGYFPMAMHVRYHGGQPARVNDDYLNNGYEAKYAIMPNEDREQLLKILYGENGIIRDTRWATVEKAGQLIAPPEWFYGYSSFSLDAALRINGFNELLDGQKGLEDVDFGIRLNMAGYKDVLLLSKDLWVIEHEHLPCKIDSPIPFKCNYGIIQYSIDKNLYVANTSTMDRNDCDFIKNKICPSCPNYIRCKNEMLGGRFYIDNDLFDIWIRNQSVFDIRSERLEV